MTHIKVHATTMVRILPALAALSFSMAVPSMGAMPDSNLDIPVAAPGMDPTLSATQQASAQTLTGIDIQKDAEGLSVSISGDGTLLHEATRLGEHRLVIDIPQVSSTIRKSLVNVKHRLLKQIRIGYHTDKVRLVFDLENRAEYVVEPHGATLVVKLKDATAGESAVENDDAGIPQMSFTQKMGNGTREAVDTVQSRRTQKAQVVVHRAASAFRVRPVQMMAEPDAAEKHTPKEDLVLGETRYVGRRISLDFQQADISNVLRLIAEVSGFNIVIGESVKSKVTMKLVSVPWDQALDMILKMNGLGKIKQGSILWIDSLANLAKQEDEEARAKDAKVKSEDLVDRVFYIRNLQATELMTSLKQNLSPRGLMQISQGTNALVVRDTETKMAILKQLIDGLDLQVPQVQIEARIVQADTVYARGLGVQWGIQNADFGPNTFSAVGNLTGPFAPVAGTGATTIPRDFLVNLPAQVAGLPAVPGIGYTFGKLAPGFALDLRLSAGELLGLAKVIAAPKITTLDKREAKISQGESIPFQTTSLQGTQTTFVDANLELNVTPQITSRDPKEVGKQIMMKVRATRNAVGARSNPAGPSIDRREANTQVIVRDGETMVIGGVFIDTQNNNVQGVPYLSRIPVLGWLFKNKSESVSKQELLIFLTPSIVQA
ncbi:MAG TPA: type IV pilus secretin PilQ [Nitrospira sp.]|nr:type IV pilus secretin PilQ [Nitrospira sp.]